MTGSLQDLPDEILLEIFSFLTLKDLQLCFKVTSRFKKIAEDTSLWETIGIKEKSLGSNDIRRIVRRGVKHLQLHWCNIFYESLTWKQEDVSKLKCFRMTVDNNENYRTVSELLTATQLERFTMHAYHPGTLNDELFNNFLTSISLNGNYLKSLDLCIIEGSLQPHQFDSFQAIVDNCCQLTQLSIEIINGSHLQTLITYIFDNLTSKIVKLSLICRSQIHEGQIQALVNRCTQLRELDLRTNNLTLSGMNLILENLPQLENLCLPICIGSNIEFWLDEINLNGAISRLKSMKSLKNLWIGYTDINYLDLDNNGDLIDINYVSFTLKKQLPQLHVNEKKLCLISEQPWNSQYNCKYL